MDEKRVFYLLVLISEFKKGLLFRGRSGTLADFERACGVSVGNFPFRKWLKSIDILEKDSEGYSINGNKAMREVKKILGIKNFNLIGKFYVDGFV